MNTKKLGFGITALLCIVSLVVGAVLGMVGFYIYDKSVNPLYVSDIKEKNVTFGDIEFHFLELGNGYTGDSVYIKCGETDILVDAGSRSYSSTTITQYLKTQIEDDKLEFVIATHADQDHIAGFAGDNKNPSVFRNFEVETIIDFPRTNKNTATYQKYCQERDMEIEAGAKHYTALQCYNNVDGGKRSYNISDTATLNILYNYYYENNSNDENNYSVCFQIIDGDNKYLFTGDLEKDGEEKLVTYQDNNLSKVKLFKAGHHGSKTSSNDVLLDVIQPEICVVCCCAGSVEYTQNFDNTFPTVDFINRISKWTDQVYVTTYTTVKENGLDKNGNTKYADDQYGSLNGTVVVSVSKNGITVVGSKTSEKLKDTEWFKANRTTPQNWLESA